MISNPAQKETIMKGDTVVVRAYGGEPKVVRVWDIGEKVILICSEENFQTLSKGKKGLWPVGVPKETVFRYNPQQVSILKNWQNDPSLWEHLKLYV
jgi:hypothetical protein